MINQKYVWTVEENAVIEFQGDLFLSKPFV